MRRVFHRKAHKRAESERQNELDKIEAGLRPVSPTSRDEDGGERTTATNAYFDVGVAGDCNRRYRKTMEDTSVVILDYMGVPGCAFFGVFDGHAGAQCARACAQRLHELLADELAAQTEPDVPRALATTFETMDERLVDMSIRHSGSTALVAVCCFVDRAGAIAAPDAAQERRLFVANVGDSRAVLGTPAPPAPPPEPTEVPSVVGVSHDDAQSERTVADADADAGVAWEAKRLSYDHRCSDVSEQRRVDNAGGLVMNNRVNGMLAVTRSLGDLFMKSYVVGTPYTTDTLVGTGPEVLVMACDGLWDVCSDEKAVDIVQQALADGQSALESSESLLKYALQSYSTDNLTTMVVHLLDPARSATAARDASAQQPQAHASRPGSRPSSRAATAEP